jgi:hypothetical protein
MPLQTIQVCYSAARHCQQRADADDKTYRTSETLTEVRQHKQQFIYLLMLIKSMCVFLDTTHMKINRDTKIGEIKIMLTVQQQ